MNYHIIRSPESPGRPEKYIADAVVAAISERLKDTDQLLWDHNCNKDQLDPENGANFYRSDVTASMLGWAATSACTMADGDVVFIMDAQAPIAQIIRYLCLINGITVKLVGLFHSSAYTHGDMFYGKNDAVYNERLTLEQLDLTLVATTYLADNLSKCMPRCSNVRVMNGLPMDHVPTELAIPFAERDKVCVWPHRLADDKGKDFMLKLAKSVSVRILTPTPLGEELTHELTTWGVDVRVCETREQYFKELGRAKVVLSTAYLETFGYAMMEGVAMGCIPLVPERACYVEQYNVRYRYPSDGMDDVHDWCVERIQDFFNRDTELDKSPIKVDPKDATSRIVDAILSL